MSTENKTPPFIEQKYEFKKWLRNHGKKETTIANYISYLSKGSFVLSDCICIDTFCDNDRVIEILQFLRENMLTDDFGNTQSAIKQYHEFAAQIVFDIESFEETQQLTTNIDRDAITSFHDAAFNYFKTKGTSRTQEKMVEYSFLRDIIIQAACKNKSISISRSDFDAFGFDVLLGLEDKLIRVQMKAYNGKAANWDVHKSLLEAKDGRVVIGNVGLIDNYLQVQYYMLDPQKRKIAIGRAPRVTKEGRCKVSKGDLIDISNDLLQLFDSVK